MEFHFAEPQTDLERLFGGFFYINAIGRIETGDDVRFKDFLFKTNPPPRLTVYIDSAGGDVDAAIGIGRLIRKYWFSTSVGSYVLDQDHAHSPVLPRKLVTGICASAATLVYLGGRLRYLPSGSKFGVHQFSFRNPAPDDLDRSQVLSARISSYLQEMRVSLSFLELSSSTGNAALLNVEPEKLQEIGVITGALTEAEWTVQAKNRVIYVKGERDSMYGHHKVMLCYSKGVGFLFWCVIESQGREDELNTCSLVEIVVNGEDVRIDISSRCERHVFGVYTNVIANITEEEARQIAFSDSFGLQIRFSSDAPMFVGVGAVSTEGGKEQLQTFFNTLCTD